MPLQFSSCITYHHSTIDNEVAHHLLIQINSDHAFTEFSTPLSILLLSFFSERSETTLPLSLSTLQNSDYLPDGEEVQNKPGYSRGNLTNNE